MDGKGFQDQERLHFKHAPACADHTAPRSRRGGGRASLSLMPARFPLPPGPRIRSLSCCSGNCRELPAPCRLPRVAQVHDCLMRDSSSRNFCKYSKDVQKGRNAGHGGTSTTPEKKRPHKPDDDGVPVIARTRRS
jgi:hypothetical protein